MPNFHCALLLLLLSSIVLANSRNGKHESEWPSYGHDPGGMRYSPLKQINSSNVASLSRVWTYRTGEKAEASEGRYKLSPFECTPLVIGGVMYLSTPFNRVIALDAETGKEIWKFDPETKNAAGKRELKGQHRGVAYWAGFSLNGKPDKRILFGTYDGRLIALDAITGKPCLDFGKQGTLNLREGIADRWPKAEYGMTSPPAIYRNLVITGSAVPESPPQGPSGMIRAFDVRTGELVWRFHTIPQPGQFGHETWEGGSWKDRTGVNVWSIMSVDSERGVVFLPLGSPAYDFYGGDRKGHNLFGNSLVALDAATGKRLWHYQLVHHDIWDFDLPAQPSLVTIRHNGQFRPAVVQVTKMGLVFVFDRLTGKPLFPIEERAVPASSVPGEFTSLTQPFPVKPPPLSRNTIRREDLTTVTPESQKYCSEIFDSATTQGIYTPLSEKLTLMFPGTLGGATWSGVSFDPSTGYLYVNANEVGTLGALKRQPEGSPVAYRRTSPWGEYARFWDENRYPCQQPPWGTLNAINLNTGEPIWRVPLGVVDSLLKKGIPQTGTPSLGGSIVTAGGLVFIAGTNDSRFRAFDAQTGKELWVTRLEASGHATPVTYLGKKSKRQFVVIAAGGGGYFSTGTADALAAFALPKNE
jgi:membrane-bound PQQ-dependent dehydrogenase (glucose/quinate/shikimate family)